MIIPVLSSSFPCSVRVMVEWTLSFSLTTFFLLSRFLSVCGSICGGWGFLLIVSSSASSAVFVLRACFPCSVIMSFFVPSDSFVMSAQQFRLSHPIATVASVLSRCFERSLSGSDPLFDSRCLSAFFSGKPDVRKRSPSEPMW